MQRSLIDQLRTVESEIVINAPQQLVWDILVDLERYADWNPFTYWMEPKLVEGGEFKGKVKLAEGALIEEGFEVRVVDPPNVLVWGGDIIPKWLLFPNRYQVLTPIDAITTRYQTWETFKGPLGLVAMLSAKSVKRGFTSVCVALKARAEQVYQEREKRTL